MKTQPYSEPATIRATLTSCLILSGIWVLLAAGYLLLSLRSPGKGLETGALIAGGVALLWCIWLRGFKITVANGRVEYRDGFFRSSKVFLSEISEIRNVSIGWNVFGRKIAIPRIVVIKQDGERAMLINPKPFGRHDLHELLDKLKADYC